MGPAVLNGADDGCLVRRISAGEIEAAVIDQVRTLLRQPEVVVGTWSAAHRRRPFGRRHAAHGDLHGEAARTLLEAGATIALWFRPESVRPLAG